MHCQFPETATGSIHKYWIKVNWMVRNRVSAWWSTKSSSGCKLKRRRHIWKAVRGMKDEVRMFKKSVEMKVKQNVPGADDPSEKWQLLIKKEKCETQDCQDCNLAGNQRDCWKNSYNIDQFIINANFRCSSLHAKTNHFEWQS